MSTHLNRDRIESNLSVPGIRGYQENALVCTLAPTSLQGQSESRPNPDAGPKGILVLTHRPIKLGLISKLLMRAFSWCSQTILYFTPSKCEARPFKTRKHTGALCLRFAFFCCVCTVVIIQCTRLAKVDMNATSLVEKILC